MFLSPLLLVDVIFVCRVPAVLLHHGGLISVLEAEMKLKVALEECLCCFSAYVCPHLYYKAAMINILC